MTHRMPLWCGAAALALVLAAAPASARPIKVIFIPYLSFAPLFIAEADGYFAAEDVEVELIPVSQISAAIPTLIEGDIDVLPAALMPAYFNIINRGGLMRIVAGKGYNSKDGCAYSGIMARRALIESGELETARDLRSRRVSTERSSPSYYQLHTFIRSGGLHVDDLTVIDLPQPAKFDAFATGALDVTTASEPWVTRFVRAGHAVMWAPTADHLPGFQFGYLLFGPTLLVGDRDSGERFVLAYLKAIRSLNEKGKTPRHVDILHEYTGLDRELLREACWPSLRNDGRASLDSLAAYQRWALAEDLIDSIAPIEQLYEDRFIERANRLVETSRRTVQR